MKRMTNIALMTTVITAIAGGFVGTAAASGPKPIQQDSVKRYLVGSADMLIASVDYAEQAPAQQPGVADSQKARTSTGPAAGSIEAGQSTFQQNCAFCHGRDAAGGETGPDLTRSKLVAEDVVGNKINEIIHNGRIEKGMPRFPFSELETANVVAFIHSQALKAQSQTGKRRGVEVADLQTGNVEAGKKYFNGAGGCISCHSATGDLAGVAAKYQGLQLEQRMLYPRDAKSTVVVTLPSGQKVEGALAYQDEFTVALRDSTNTYRSWSLSTVQAKVNSPVDGHVDLFSKYTDDDIHNLMAYIQALK
ncbi:hypothetical protein BH10ACI4_BH10ACI4_16160 [soil metagenome]